MSESIVYFDGRFVPLSEAKIPALTHCLHYGTGVFEGIRAWFDPVSGNLLLFRALEHFERMSRNVGLLNIRLPHAPPELLEIATELLRLNRPTSDMYVRPLAYKAAEKVGVSLPAEDGFLMIAVPMGSYVDTKNGLSCCVSSWRRLQDNSIPCRAKICGAYVNSALAAQEARDRGFDEAIFLNEAGHVAEGSAMNVFLVRNGRLVTPDVSQGILEGITRDTVMQLAERWMGIPTEQRTVDRTELYVADEVFFTGTAAQIAPVVRVDGRPVGSGFPGPVTTSLQSGYERLVRGHTPGHERWLRRVTSLAGVEVLR